MLSDPTERYRRNSDDVIGLSKVVFALIFLSLVAVTIWFIVIGVPGPLLATVPLALIFGVFVFLDVRNALKKHSP
jgi:Flp pilus assembly protein TadB